VSRLSQAQVVKLRAVRRGLVAATVERDESDRQGLRALRFALQLAALGDTWEDGRPVAFEQDYRFLDQALEEVDAWRTAGGIDPRVASVAAARWLEALGVTLERARRDLPPEALARELGAPQLAVAVGGGGGVSFISIGALDLIEGMGITPSMIAGASMGSVIGALRARAVSMSVEEMLEDTGDLTRADLFGISTLHNHYSIPATVRLTYRHGLARFFLRPDGGVQRLCDAPIPFRVVVTGMAGEAPHGMDFYQHLLDASFTGRSVRRLVFGFTRLLAEFFLSERSLKPIVFGACEASSQVDVLDAVGFSSSIPGLLHYDVEREDRDAHDRLAQLMREHSVSRLMDGGFTENVPIHALRGEIDRGFFGHTNVLTLGLDAFAPNLLNNPLFVPVQQLIRAQVQRSQEASDFWCAFRKPLSPLNVLPDQETLRLAIQQGRKEFAPEAAEVQEGLRDLREVGARYMPGLDMGSTAP
jgi:predicted acylesterase/phospholipase RssA